MSDVKSDIDKLIGDHNALEKLLILEKKKRKVDTSKLVFLGTANIAKYYWCALKSYLKSKQGELDFFHAYIYDRLRYAFELGYIGKLPKNKKKLLEVGDEISFEDIEKLLKKRAKKGQKVEYELIAEKRINENGSEVMIINPDITQDDQGRIQAENEARLRSIRIASPEEFPKLRGEFLETTRAKKYPKIRWHFNWNDYVIVGAPDGITVDNVYEFKSTRNKFLMSFIKPIAITQADLYGYFFRRENKLVEIYVVEENKKHSFSLQVNHKRAEETLYKFKLVDDGNDPLPPKPWKCKNCEYKDSCWII